MSPSLPTRESGQSEPGEPNEGDEARADGRKKRWSGQHERRRQEFVEAALVAIQEHGPDVTTDQIAQQAGVARTRLYKHFKGADDLNRAIAEYAVELVTADLEPVWNLKGSPAEMIRTAIGTHLAWLTEHQNLYRYLTRRASGSGGAEAVADVKSGIAGHLTELFQAFMDALGIQGQHPEPLAYGLVGYVDSAASRWLDHPAGISQEEMERSLGDAIWAILDQLLRTAGVEIDPDEPVDL